jgi:hypothetical protein
MAASVELQSTLRQAIVASGPIRPGRRGKRRPEKREPRSREAAKRSGDCSATLGGFAASTSGRSDSSCRDCLKRTGRALSRFAGHLRVTPVSLRAIEARDFASAMSPSDPDPLASNSGRSVGRSDGSVGRAEEAFSSTDGPVRGRDSPVSHTGTLVPATDVSVRHSERPVRGTDASVRHTDAPVLGTGPSVRYTDASVLGTEAPVSVNDPQLADVIPLHNATPEAVRALLLGTEPLRGSPFVTDAPARAHGAIRRLHGIDLLP